MHSILIIGAGFAGAASALRLQRAGLQVTLVDHGAPRRAASFGNIGCIAAEQVRPWASRALLRDAPTKLFAWGGPLDFRWRDAPLLAPWIMRYLHATAPHRFAAGERALTGILEHAMPAWRRLSALANASHILREEERNLVWMSPRSAEVGIRAWNNAPKGATSSRPLCDDELAQYQAVITRQPSAGVAITGTGVLNDPQQAREALFAAFTQCGGRFVSMSVETLESARTSATVGDGTGQTLEADAVLICAGAWSGRLLRQLDVHAPLIGERGYSIQSANHNWPATLPSTGFEDYSMAVSRFTTGLRASSFIEYGAPDAPGDARKWRLLQRRIRDLGIKFDPSPDRWVGPRPTLPDYVPAIGHVKNASNVYYSFGHQHLGVTLAAISAEIVEDMLGGKTPRIDVEPFAIHRFTRGT